MSVLLRVMVRFAVVLAEQTQRGVSRQHIVETGELGGPWEIVIESREYNRIIWLVAQDALFVRSLIVKIFRHLIFEPFMLINKLIEAYLT